MSKTLTLLFATTALTAAIGLPAWSAMLTPAPGIGTAPAATVIGSGESQPQLWLVDDDDDEHGDGRRGDDEDDDDCEDGGCGAANNPAPAGRAAPPENGLFDTGAAPQVQVN